MGVSLGYVSRQPTSIDVLTRLLALAAEANDKYNWWCESIWIADQPDDTGRAFGLTKIFRMIDNEDTDTYMAYLDIWKIVKFLTSTTKYLNIQWQLEIEGHSFGGVTERGPDQELNENLSDFLSIVFPGDFESLRLRSREDIMAEWSDR